MENIDILVDLALAMGAAMLGGFVAHRLRQPVILGYLVAGLLIGPYTFGPVASIERVQTLANFGVALLMFALGTEFSLESLQRVRRVAVGGGIAQILLCIVLGVALGLLLGFSLPASVFLGGIIAISSSIFILKLLMARDELESIWGRVTIGIGIVQDISVLALIVILPSLAQGVGWDLLGSAGLAVLRGASVLVIAYLAGTRLLPPLLARIARLGSRELFLLTVVAIAVGTAALGHYVGISFALGAFVGGLVVSESEFSTHVLDEIIPLREVFSTLFFVSIGMLMDPAFLVSHLFEIILLVGVIVAGKFAITALVIRLLGYTGDTPWRVGLLIAQIGEFSFVLAGVGVDRQVITDDLYRLVLAAALISLIINPLLVDNGDRLAALFRALLRPASRLASLVGGRSGHDEEDMVEGSRVSTRLASLKRHVIICGYGRVGQEIARALNRRGFPFILIDYNPTRVEEARREGYLAIQGDATHAPILERARLADAKLLAITLPDLPSAEQTIRVARSMNTRARLLARTHDARSITHLKTAGAHEIVQPEFEAGLEMVRQALRSYGVSALETQSIVGGRRQEHYSGHPLTGDAEPSASEETPWT